MNKESTINRQTALLIKKIKLMCLWEAEYQFYQLKELFTDQIDVSQAVECFQEEYDPAFTYEGSAIGLYNKFCKWIEVNIND